MALSKKKKRRHDPNEAVSPPRKLSAVVKEDMTYQRTIKNLMNVDANADSWREELMSLQARRGIRALNTSALLESSQKISIDSNIDNQACRSRATEIKMKCLQQLAVVDERGDKLRKYIMAMFAEQLADNYKTVTERRAVVDEMLSKVIRAKRRLELVTKLCDALVDDCDQAGFTLKRIGDLLIARQKDR